jgi:hypothetical protein
MFGISTKIFVHQSYASPQKTHPHLHEAQKASNATTWVALLALVP